MSWLHGSAILVMRTMTAARYVQKACRKKVATSVMELSHQVSSHRDTFHITCVEELGAASLLRSPQPKARHGQAARLLFPALHIRKLTGVQAPVNRVPPPAVPEEMVEKACHDHITMLEKLCGS